MNAIKKQNRKHFVKRYFLDVPSTLILPFFFVTLSLIVFLQQFPQYDLSIKKLFDGDIFDGLINTITGIYSFIILTIMVGFYAILKNRIKNVIKSEPINKVEPFVIDDYNKGFPRDKQFKELLKYLNNNANKYGFILGNSGTGKSTLLSRLKDENDKGENYEYGQRVKILREYAIPYKVENELIEIKKSCNNSKITRILVIFDQFERAILDKETYGYIDKFLEETKNTVVTPFFVSTNQQYIEALRHISRLEIKDKDIHVNDFYIQTEFEDRDKMVECLRQELKKKEIIEPNDKRLIFFNEFLSKDDISMIEVNIARIYFTSSHVYDNNEDEWKNTLDQEFPIEVILEKYFNIIFSGIEDSYLAMVILYAICYSDYTNILTVKDFQNLTFLPLEKLFNNELENRGILNILEDKKIIRQIIDTKQTLENTKPTQYIMTHDYLVNYLEDYCSGKLSEQITTNIRCYCKEKKKYEREKNSEGSVLSPYYDKTVIKTDSSTFLKWCLAILCFSVTAVCVWYEITGFGKRQFWGFTTEFNHNLLAMNVLATGSAVFYIYHYLYHFAKIFFSKINTIEFWVCGLVVFGGISAIVLSMLFYEISVIFIACEWLIVAIFHLVLSKKQIPNEVEKTRLEREGTLYIIIGIVMIILNIVVLLFGGITTFHYLIFFALVCFIIRQQIHNDFMLAKLITFVSIRNAKSLRRKE